MYEQSQASIQENPSPSVRRAEIHDKAVNETEKQYAALKEYLLSLDVTAREIFINTLLQKAESFVDCLKEFETILLASDLDFDSPEYNTLAEEWSKKEQLCHQEFEKALAMSKPAPGENETLNEEALAQQHLFSNNLAKFLVSHSNDLQSLIKINLAA